MAKKRSIGRIAASAAVAIALLVGTGVSANANAPMPAPASAPAPAPSSNIVTGSSNPNSETCTDKIMVTVPPTIFSLPGILESVPSMGMIRFADNLRGRGVHTVSAHYNALWDHGVISYCDSRDQGIANAEAKISELAAECRNSTISLAGYSSGADIKGNIVSKIAQGNGPIPHVRFGVNISIASPSRSTVGTHMVGTAGESEGLLPPLDYGHLAGRVYELYDEGDSVCDATSVLPTAREIGVDPIGNHAFSLPGETAETSIQLFDGLPIEKALAAV